MPVYMLKWKENNILAFFSETGTSWGRTISWKVLAQSQAQTWDFYLKFLWHISWAHGLNLYGLHKKVSVLALAEPLAQMLRLVGSGLSFVNIGSDMAAIIDSPIQNLKWLKIRYKYTKQSPAVVFGCFYMFTEFPIAK